MTFDFDTIGLDPKTKAVSTDGPNYNTVTLRERDSTAQERVPLAKLAEIIEQLVLRGEAWDVVVGRFCGGAGAPEPEVETGGDSEGAAYLEEHKVLSVIEEAFNKMMSEKPADPVAFMAALLAEKK